MHQRLTGTIVVEGVVIVVYISILIIYWQQYNHYRNITLNNLPHRKRILRNICRWVFLTIVSFLIALVLWLGVDLFKLLSTYGNPIKETSICEIISLFFVGLSHSSLLAFEYYLLNTLFEDVMPNRRFKSQPSIITNIFLSVCIVVVFICEPVDLTIWAKATYSYGKHARVMKNVDNAIDDSTEKDIFWIAFVLSICAMVVGSITITYLFSN